MAKRKWPGTKPVEVRWIDSMGTPGWGADKTGKGGWKTTRHECVTVGTLVKKGRKTVAIALNRSHYSHGEMIEIPRCAVLSMRKLRK